MLFNICLFLILVVRIDIFFMMYIIFYLVRMSNFNFIERVLFVDIVFLFGDKVMCFGVGSLSEFRDCCSVF